jgi:transformation/transcription domain-associated protein
MLLSILDTFKVKFEELNRSFPKQKEDDAMDEDTELGVRDVADRRPIKTLSQPTENPSDPIKGASSLNQLTIDGRYLFKNLVSGFKTLLFGLRSCNPPAPAQFPNAVQWNDVARVTKPEEVRLMIDLFRECGEGFMYWAVDRPKIPAAKARGTGWNSELPLKLPGATNREEKDSLDAFSTFFMHLDSAVLHEILKAEMDTFFTQMLRNPALVSIPQSMLATEISTTHMCTVLLNFLMKQLPTLGDDNGVREVLIITMLRLCFMSVTLFPEHNEAVLVPHLGEIMTSCIKNGASAKVPANYYMVLQMLFKNIGAGRFELLYKEVLPLMQNVLESLNSLLESARKPSERDLYAELCLTFPVRLSVLLPYLSYLMKPLVHALYGPVNLVSQALRTLELCVDNLTSDFLDPILNPVITDLMTALRSHLKPSSAGGTLHAHLVVRILGKLGGRNRQYLSEPSTLKYDAPPEHDPGIMIEFDGASGKEHFNHLQFVNLALKTIQDPKLAVDYKRQAFNFLRSSLYAFIPHETILPDFAKVLRECSDGMISEAPESSQPKEEDAMEEEPVMTAAIFEHRAIKKATIFPSSWPRRYGTDNFLDKILQGIFHSITVDDIKEEVKSLIFDFCQYFAVLEIAETNEDAINTSFEESGKTYRADGNLLSPHVLVDAIVEALCSEHDEVIELATQAIERFIEAAVIIIGPQGHVGRLSMFNMLAIKFRHYCYRREWYFKAGGCRGIEILCNTPHFDTAWLLHYQMDFTKALLFIVKDVPPELSPRTNDSAKRVLRNLLAKCNSADVAEDTPENNLRWTHLLQHLVLELQDRNAGARETVQDALRQLSELKGTELSALMQVPKDMLLGRMYSKPLRTLHFHNQIASIDALNFCFGVQPAIVEQNKELQRFLEEVVATAGAEDDDLIPQSRMSQHRNASALVELRIACLNLLSTVMSTPSFVQNNMGLRATIIGIFFKYLYWKNPDVINAASTGLRRLVSQTTKLPKELLQAGLKPVLMNMADHKRLTVEGLEGLATLLELLNTYFKVEIGKKLLDHLKSFLEPVSELHEVAKRSLDEVPSIIIVKSIVNVFHLLPTGANQFMVDLINIVMDLEVTLRRTHFSPFRTPLLKFLNRYPSDSWAHFGERLGQGHFGRLYSQIIADPAAALMREAVQKDRAVLLQRAFEPETEVTSERILAAVNGLHIINALTCHNPKWISEDPEFVVGLLERTVELAERGRESPMEEDNLQVKQAVQVVVDVFVAYLDQEPSDIRFFLDLTSAISSKLIDLYPAFSDFLFTKIVSSRHIDLRRQYLKEGLQLFSNRSAKQEFKTFVFCHVINPILIVTYSREEKLVDKALLSTVNRDVWKPLVAEMSPPAPPVSETALCKDDALKLEVIQMSTLLIHHSSTLAADHRKDIIRLGYGLIRTDDITVRYAAYVLIANFISKYDCPPKIPVQIYVALLKAHQTEAKALVRQALDTMAPVLPEKIPLKVTQSSYRVWPRRAIGEDSQNIGQLVNVFQFLVRQADLFYEHRELYMPQFINSLPRLAFVQNANHETKALAIDMVETIYKWEKRRVEEMRSENVEMEMTPKSAKTPVDKESYTTPLMLREATITFLIRFTCLTPDATTKALIPLSKRTVELVRDLMGEDYWPEVNVKLSFFERNLAMNEATDAYASSFVPALEVLRAILENQARDRIVQNAGSLGHLLAKSLRSESVAIQDALQPLLRVVLSAVAEEPAEEDNEATQLIATLVQVAQDNLGSFTNLNTAVTILEELLPKRPDTLDTVSSNLVKVFQRLVKDHITPAPADQPHSANPAAAASAAAAENAAAPATLATDTVLSLMFRIIEFLKSRLSRLGEHRRWFLSGLVQLIERSNSAELCRKMLMVAREWTVTMQDSFPSAKEKTAVIIKMNSFEGRGDNQLVNDYLRLILDVYENTELQRTELTTRLEPSFMFGVRCEDYELRNKFIDLFSSSMSVNVFSRLNYIILIQNWEYSAQHYWINVALSLLMGAIVPDRTTQQTKSSFLFRRFSDMKKYVAYGRSEELMQVDEDSEAIVEDKLEDLVSTCRRVVENARKVTTGDILEPLRQLQYLDDHECHRLWVSLFASAWHVIKKRDRLDIRTAMIPLLSQEYHGRQMEKRPNVVITLMEGVGRCSPVFKLPPHVVKYLGTTYNAWYVSLNILENATLTFTELDTQPVKDSHLDALAEMYAALGEEDMFYGLWRRRCVLLETNAAMSFEQNGMWDKAMQMYENAQVRARTGALPYSASEYHLWEDHWIRCAQKLQQWELLSDIANKENYSDLLLECAWRISEWTADRDMLENHVNSLMEFPTPRRQVFAAYVALAKQTTEFPRLVDEGTQLSLKKWHSLPPIVTQAHTPLFGIFQQYVELTEARDIFLSLQQTTAQNLDAKSAELKTILQTWRERLPNIWEDINMWSDLVSWRQLVFAQINRTYLPLVRELPGNAAGTNSQASAFAYRGYHETAWIINRFAHVARKHQLPDVCISQLTKIYTLPNIEIQEAFLKLREQAKCYYYNNSELTNGLEVISNTNLMYFVTQQKAEFYTLKGMFLAKLKQDEEANSAFATAVQIDLSLAKAWAEWGHYNDRKFKESNVDLALACHAVGCYLQAASLFKSGKARKALARVLWLMSLDDEHNQVSKAWAGFKGEVPVWYWITFIPQLLTSLSHREARNARDILMRIAKLYPQVHHFRMI